MANKLSHYRDRFSSGLKIDSVVKRSIAQEIYTHLEDKSQELKEKGLSEEEANNIAVESFGPPQLIAQQIYEVHSRGSYREAFFASLPHLLVALLFTSYYWQNIICLSGILVAVTGVVVYGWYHNKPMWFFPWLGYYLLPVVVTGILLIYLLQGWVWLATLIYIPLALFVVIYILKEAASRDWLYVSLMLTPLPVVLSWLLALGTGNEFLVNSIPLAKLQVNIPWIVISFLVLAMATFTFTRVRQRWCKAAALLIPASIILILVAIANRGSVNFCRWLILTLSLFALASPVLLRTRSQ